MKRVMHGAFGIGPVPDMLAGALAAGLALCLALPAGAQSRRDRGAAASDAVAAPTHGQVSLTVYNQNFALVKDVRNLQLASGNQEIRIDDVAATIDATSVHFGALDHPRDVAVLEQNYQYDLADADRLLQRYLGQDVTAVVKDGSTKTGTLLSFDGGSLVLVGKDGASIVNRAEVQDIRLGEVPGGLVVKPTLVWTLASGRTGPERVEVSYLANSINWHAEYVAVVNQKDTALGLDGWVSLDNRSGATYTDAKLKLVAGDVHRVQERQPRFMPEAPVALKSGVAEPQFQEREFFEYHIYTLERPATVADRETKQLSLFPSASAGAKKVLTYDATQNPTKVAVRMEFENSRENRLGMALPAGKVRVYKEDADGALEFVGEDRIDHTPRDEKVRLFLGYAFDVVGERKRTDFRKITNRSQEETYEIQVRNHKDERVDVVVVEHLYGDWEIRTNSHEFTKKDSNTVEFPLSLGADATATVTYTVRTSW
jgi:hypothetical protein